MYSSIFNRDRKDLFASHGYVRLVLWWSGKKPKESYSHGYELLLVDAFEHDKLLTEGNSGNPAWIEEEIHNDYNDWIDSYLEDKEIGFYEILGRFYFHGWTSGYETQEYESEWELRHVKSRKATYDEASGFGETDFIKDSEVRLLESHHRSEDTISPYMSRRQIMNVYAYCLHSLARDWNGEWTRLDKIEKISDEELNNLIFMMSLLLDEKYAIDEEVGPTDEHHRVLPILRAMHTNVDKVLKEHDEIHSVPEPISP